MLLLLAGQRVLTLELRLYLTFACQEIKRKRIYKLRRIFMHAPLNFQTDAHFSFGFFDDIHEPMLVERSKEIKKSRKYRSSFFQLN